MWPVLLNMTRDDCRRTLRRLELEAYSNMISVFRAQGPLEDGRRKLLEELREALHIGGDRHSAEARRAANDELLATIAEQLSGPNTGLAWISEGRRRIPLMPRGIPQTLYTELADKVALQAAAENEEIARRQEVERLVAPRSEEAMELVGAEGTTAEGELPADADLTDEALYPPIVMEDQSIKLLEMEAFGRKRKVPESGALPEDVAAAHALTNTARVTNQKHLNLSQIYSNYSKPPSGKSSGQSKHSYNQVSKVSSKPIQSHTPRSSSKRRKQNPAERSDRPKSSSKTHIRASKLSNQQMPLSSKPYAVNPMSMQMDFSQPPPTFQASYAQSILSVGLKNYGDDVKTQPNILSESPTMRLLTQPATVPHELGVIQPDDPSGLQAQSTPIKSISGKACQFIIKKKSNLNLDNPPSPQKLQMSEIKILKKPVQNIKVLQKKPIIVTPGMTHKELNATGKLMPTKFIQKLPSKAPAGLNSPNSDKIVTVSGGPQHVQKSLPSTKNFIISSSAVSSTVSKPALTVESSNTHMKPAEIATPKGNLVNDVKKISTKTFVLNPKSGQKMVVLPAKGRGKTEGQTMPLIHFKSGISTTMKLVPVSSSVSQLTKTSNVTIVPKASLSNTVATTNSKTGIEGIISTISQDGSSTPKVTALPIKTKFTGTPIMRQSTTKGNVIVVQKGTPIGKTLAFAKSGGEMSKIVMSKNVNKLIQAQSLEQQSDSSKNPGFILLDLNDQDGTTTTMSKILDSHSAKSNQIEEANKLNLQAITEDTPVLFDTQIAEETCNANSMDSLSTGELTHMEEGTISSIEKEDEIKSADNKESESAKDTSSSVTDWEMELDTAVGRKRKAEDGSSLHLDMCMSSDSETDAYLVKTEKPKSKPSPREGHREGATEESSVLYGDRGLSRASRTLLSQLQDEGSSSNDSSFTLNKAKLGHEKSHDGAKPVSGKLDENKTERKRDSPAKAQTKRIDMFSAADIHLDSFAYLEEGMDDMFHVEGKSGRGAVHAPNLDEQLSQLLSENAASDANSVSETLPLSK